MHARLTTSHTLNEICSFASEPQSPFIHMSSSPACSRVAYVKTVLTLLEFKNSKLEELAWYIIFKRKKDIFLLSAGVF